MKKIVLAIMLVLGFGLTNASANENTPEGVILAFYKACVNGDLKKAMSYLDKDSFKRNRNGILKDERERQASYEVNAFSRDTFEGKPIDKSQWQFTIIDKIDFYNVEIRNISVNYVSTGTVIQVKKVNGVWKIITIV